MREIELLAPARDLTTGIEAIRHGADAVYIGADRFGARAAAGNSVEDIRQLVEFAHPYGVKVYVTLNTILFDNELDDAHRLTDELYDAGVDALIVQDMAVVGDRRIEAGGKRIPLHASTQMDNRTAEKVAWLRDLGFEQVILARELTLEEISEIHRQVPDVRLEVFIHGAICVSYNGQCYASQHCFGRSANRGECAQFCRMPFDLIDADGNVLQRQKHLLSLRDMNRSADLEALLDAGASSLKIEGRLKDTAYVKNVVAYYRQRLDEILRRRNDFRRSSIGHEDISFTPNPAKSFNRLFTDYFMHGRTPDMTNIFTPKSMGEPIGYAEWIVERGKKKEMSNRMPERATLAERSGARSEWLELRDKKSVELHNGDGLCFINDEGQLIGFRVNRVEGNRIIPTQPSPVTAPFSSKFLYRNHDQQFLQLLSKPTATRKIYVRWLLKETDDGFLLRLTREDGQSTEMQFPYPHELARSPQMEQISNQLSRLGDTPYECTGVDVEMTDNWFIPGSILAEWRRKIVRDEKKEVSNRTPERATLAERSGARSENPSSNHINGSISYLGNIANHVARKFYLDHGASQVEWALEVEKPKHARPLLLMTCRYCIRHELGLCPKQSRNKNAADSSPSRLLLRLSDGRRFPLRFDCKQCIMEVYAES